MDMISVVIPVYNEEENIRQTLLELQEALRNTTDYEIIVVNDGSTDKTSSILSSITGIRTVSYHPNRGKGYALRKGISQSRGEYIGFVDGDGEIAPALLVRLYEEIKKCGADGIIGCKLNLKKSVMRKVYSLGFRVVCWLLFGISGDTQTGIKLFNNKIKSLSIRNDGYIFDLELVMACRENKLTVREFPVELRNVKKTGRIGVRHTFQILNDLIQLKRGTQSCSSQENCGYYLP